MEENISREMYTIRNFKEILTMDIKPAEQIWGGLCKERGALCEIIGEPGLGKTLLMFVAAVSQILHLPFPSEKWPMYDKPLKWLFLGTENSLQRWRSSEDTVKGKLNLTDAQVELLGKHLFLPTLEQSDDANMLLTDEHNRQKVENTVRHYTPDVIVWDPWGDLLDNELDDGEIKRTVGIIRRIDASSGADCTVSFLLNHSRSGTKQMAAARGGDAANFGRNSKKIYACARSVVNLRPIVEGDRKIGIELIHAKHNNTSELPPAAVRFVGKDEWLETIPEFDHDACQERWDIAAGNISSREAKSRWLSEEQKQACIKSVANQLLEKELPTASGHVCEMIREEANSLGVAMSKASAADLLPKLTGSEYGLETWERKQPRAKFITTPEQRKAQEAKDSDDKIKLHQKHVG